jgi:hypothetical protein
MMEAASTSETSVNFYPTTRHYKPEHSHLDTEWRLENLKGRGGFGDVSFGWEVALNTNGANIG